MGEYLTPPKGISEPFFVADALIEYLIRPTRFSESPRGLRIRRVAMSSGSARYEYRWNKVLLAQIQIRAITAQSTLIETFTEATEHPGQQMADVSIQIIMTRLAGREESDAIDTEQTVHRLEARLLELIQGSDQAKRAALSHEPPARDAPIDEWLDWRDRQIERGRTVSYTKLSAMSDYNDNQFKYAQSKRTKIQPD
jgi:hypothetical protein